MIADVGIHQREGLNHQTHSVLSMRDVGKKVSEWNKPEKSVTAGGGNGRTLPTASQNIQAARPVLTEELYGANKGYLNF